MIWSAGCGSIDAADGQDANAGDAAGADESSFDASACLPPRVACDGICADTQSDPRACGSCITQCHPGEVCAAGACISACPASQAVCSSADGGLRCTDALTDNANCGYCGHVCASGLVCSSGKCGVACSSSQTLCTAGDGTQFCSDLQSDPDNCNACGNACPPAGANVASTSCVAGKCSVTCTSPMLDCNGQAADGCEVDPQTDALNCGACGNLCAVGATCTGNVCACETGYGQARDACNGLCVDLQTDPANCGACNTRCTPASASQSAGCVAAVCRSSNRVATTSNVASIAVDDTYVYFAQTGVGVERMPKASPAATPTLIATDTTATSVALDATTIYWGDGNGVFSCPITGCVGSPKELSDLSTFGHIYVHGGKFYFAYGSWLERCSTSGCAEAPTRLQIVYTTPMLAFGPSSVFASLPFEIDAITLTDPPTSTALTTSSTSNGGLAFGAGKLFWESYPNVMMCDPTACSPSALVPIPSTGSLVADDVALFWAADGIHETILASGVDSVIANLGHGANQLALDATNVYWAGSDGVYWAAR